MMQAGEYLKGSDPWAYDPNPMNAAGVTRATIQNPVYSCRPSYHILMTDGIWNDLPLNVPNLGDHSALALPDGVQYNHKSPFYDATIKTLADLAFYYWATDARPTLENNVKPIIVAPNSNQATQYWDPRNDPATWQHMVTFTIGLGLSTSLSRANIPWAGDTYAGPGYAGLANGTLNWPPASAGSNDNVYDLWHAAINSRGQFFSADSPDAIVNAFSRIINLIGDRTSTSSRPAVKSAVGNVEAYRAQFSSDDWSGDLIRTDDSGGTTWSAKTRLAALPFANRKIKIYSATDSTHLQSFNWDNLSDAQKALFNRNPDSNSSADSNGNYRVDFIRGDRSREGTAVGSLRKRGSVLGDIVNSSPLLVGPPAYWASFANSIEGDDSDYAAFKSAHAGRSSMVYVGANDGMLHAFDAESGDEKFAFIPSAVIENLYLLTGQSYTGSAHRYYVDGSPVSADVYFGGAWHTVLIGTLGGGGKSIFALDITDPNNIKLLWEKSYSVGDANLSALGYTFPKPYIARLYSGQWAVITGNGYSGTNSGQAALMVLDVQTGDVLKKLVAQGDASRANGLSSVVVSDYNSDGVAEYAYAGDLQGNLWRFDLLPGSVHSSTASDPFKRGAGGIADSASYLNDFTVAYGGHPLYTAKDRRAGAASTAQPITAPPSLVRHPTGLGYLVIFGTGKYYETGDSQADTTRAMSLYGIWDRQTKGQSTTAHSPALSRSDLVLQEFSTPDSNPFTSISAIRTLSRNAVSWYRDNATATEDSDVNAWGWVLDLAVNDSYSGEMMVQPLIPRGSTLLVDSMIPSDDPCSGGSTNWLLGIDPYTGGATTYNVFDLNRNGIIDSSDSANGSVVAGFIAGTGTSGGSNTAGGEMRSGDINSKSDRMHYSSGPDFTGRQSWRVIPEVE